MRKLVEYELRPRSSAVEQCPLKAFVERSNRSGATEQLPPAPPLAEGVLGVGSDLNPCHLTFWELKVFCHLVP